MARLKELGIDKKRSQIECEATIEILDGDLEYPEHDAEETFSYWVDSDRFLLLGDSDRFL